MRKGILVLYLIVFAFCVEAQQQLYSISGKVIDAVSKLPLPSASVFANNTHIGTVTDAGGNFTLSVPAGEYELAITFTGYQSQIVRINSVNSTISPLTISLNNSIVSFETMHVHFDKDFYLPGETIWFKAYLYNVNEISIAATNFYAALYDEKGKLLLQKQYPIMEGSCYGDFTIPDTIQSSRVQFRAFTKAMIINDTANVYQQILTIANTSSHPDSIASNKTQTLQFFPEGGQMVAEMENQIAFKASYPDGSPAMIKGQIFEVERNKRIDTFFTNSIGLGKFIIIPSPKKTYEAIWKDQNGIIHQTPLPNISRYGISFHSQIIGNELQYSIVKNKTTDTLNNLHIVAQMGYFQVYKADLSIPAEMEIYTVKFPVNTLPAGLMQLTLFDNFWNLLQQRLIFINDAAIKNRLVVNTDSINLNPKAKNSIELILPDTTFTILSASVADINFYNQSRTNTIIQDLYFNPQLKELKQNASQLVIAGNSGNIDLIAQTHHWKKFNWQKLINKDEVKQDFLDHYITLHAEYKEKNLALPKDDALNLILSNGEMGKQLYNLKAANQTSFEKENLIFFDSIKITYQMDKNKELANYISISKNENLAIPLTIAPLQKNISFISKDDYLSAFKKIDTSTFNTVKTIKEVVVKDRRKGNPELERIEELDKTYTTGMFSGTVRGYQLNVLDDPTAKTIADIGGYIAYRVPGVQYEDDQWTGEKHIYVYESVNVAKKARAFIPLFINEVPLTDIDNVPLSDIAYIKYIPGIVIGSSFRSTVGAIYIYTKKGTEVLRTENNMHSIYIKGYNTQKEFPNPDYNNAQHLLTKPDQRTTLYWNPNIKMDKSNNKIRLEFYNNDISKKLLLKIEGINANGKLIYIEKIIE